jgi:hypothetical protein
MVANLTRENSNASKEEVEKEKALGLNKAKRIGGATSAPDVFCSLLGNV